MSWRSRRADVVLGLRHALRGMAEGIQSASGREAIRRRAAVMNLPNTSMSSARQRDLYGYKPAGPGDRLTRTAEQLRAMAMAARMFYEVPVLRQMHSKRAAFVTGAGRVRLKNVRSPRVQDLLERNIREQANTIFNKQRQDYIRWRLFGMSPYLAQPRPNGITRFHWWSPLNFVDLAVRSGNDALHDRVTLRDSRTFVEGVYALEHGRKVVREPTNWSQDPYAEGLQSEHRVIARRDRPESQRSDFDVATLDPRRDPILDGGALLLIANQEASSLGAPDYVATFDDISKRKQLWNEVVYRTQLILDKVWVYHYQTRTPEITKMQNEGWEPRPGETLWSQFMSTPGDTEKLEQIGGDIGAPALDTFFGLFDRQIILDSGMPMTWFSNPEDRVLAAIAQESPTVKDLAAWQVEWVEAQTLALTYTLETAQMMTDAVALTDDLYFEIDPEPLRAEDAEAVYKRLSQLALFLRDARATGTDPRVCTLVIREALAKEEVVDVERYMQSLGLPANMMPPPAAVDPMLDPTGGVAETFDAVARRDPEGLAALIPGYRTPHPDRELAGVGGNGNGHHG